MKTLFFLKKLLFFVSKFFLLCYNLCNKIFRGDIMFVDKINKQIIQEFIDWVNQGPNKERVLFAYHFRNDKEEEAINVSSYNPKKEMISKMVFYDFRIEKVKNDKYIKFWLTFMQERFGEEYKNAYLKSNEYVKKNYETQLIY